jgi:hypothetical protein
LNTPISSYAKTIDITEKFDIVADSYISFSDPTENYGNQEKNYLWYSPSEEYRILLAFEEINIPDEAIFSDASLKLNWFYFPSKIDVDLYEINSFNESSVCWENSPTFSSKIGSFSVTEEESSPSKWNITSIINNNGNYSFGLSTSTSTAIFSSVWAKEGTFGFFPKIEITYKINENEGTIQGFLLFITLATIIALIRLRKKAKK